MKVLVTGARGFVGTKLCEQLRGMNDSVFEADLQCGIDICDMGAVSILPVCDVLVHLAALTFVPSAFTDPRKFYYVNVIGTLNMLEYCRTHAARMVFMSSYVYGTPAQLPIDENHVRAAHNPYAQSKILGEDLCRAYNRDFGISVVVLRPFNIYGSGQSSDFLLPMIIKQARTGHILLKDPRPRRDFVHVDDVVSALAAATRYSATSWGVFNIGSGVSHSVEEIVALVISKCKCAVTVEYTGEIRSHEVLDTVANIRSAKEELQWAPTVLLEDGIRQMLKLANGE